MYSDHTSHSSWNDNWQTVAKIGVGVVLIAGFGIATVLTGGAAGLVGTIVTGTFKSAVIGSVIGGLEGEMIFDENGFGFSIEKVATGFMFASLTGAISGAIGFRASNAIGTGYKARSIMEAYCSL